MANRFKINEPKPETVVAKDVEMAVEVAEGAKNSAVIISIEKKEVRSKRVNLLVAPSVYDAAKKKCDSLGISINECINQLLEKWGNG